MNSFNLKESVDSFLFFLSQSAGITLPRIVACLAGLSLCILFAVRFWEKRMKVAPALTGFLLGSFLVAVSLDTSILHRVIDSSFLSRIRILLGLLSLFVFAITFESIRIARLKERFAFLWLATSGMVLLSALFPQLIDFITQVLGVQYVTAIVAVVFTFLLMVAFHFSIALSALEEDRAKIAQRCALLDLRLTRVEAKVSPEEIPVPTEKISVELSPVSPKSKAEDTKRKIRGGSAASWLVIGLAWLAVLVVGLRSPEPMIGDEVTHYYMLTKQVRELPTPTFFADIPNEAYEVPEVRRYPHTNGWHYVGAVISRLLPNRFWLVQLYQSLFFLQLLWVGYLWAKSRRGEDAYSAYLFVIVLASLPMNLLFGVTFYQDVPLAAQVLTSFYFLDRKKFGWAGVFMALSMWIKVTGILFLVPFMLVCAVKAFENTDCTAKPGRRILKSTKSLLLPVIFCGVMFAWNHYSIQTYVGGTYLPAEKVGNAVKAVFSSAPVPESAKKKTETVKKESSSPQKYQIVANHPGDIRNPRNLLVYFGGLFWIVLACGLFGLIRPRSQKVMQGGSRKHAWPILVGGFYILVVSVLLRTAPDARFYLPALPLLLLPVCEWILRVPKAKVLLLVITGIALLQIGYVLRKTEQLRSLSNELKEGIVFLSKHPPEPARIFMYPEGNYRFFPVEHEWYLDYGLQAFWGMSMPERISMLNANNVGGIVIKKHLIAPVNDPQRDLGSYPPEFVKELKTSPGFERVFDNSYMSIYYLTQETP